MAKRGRPTKTESILKNLKGKNFEKKTPIASEMYIPNLSGDHSKGQVRTTPVDDLDIANKKYVDDNAGGSAAGNDGEVQFNDSGSFGADSSLSWDDTNKKLGIGNNSPSVGLHVGDDSKACDNFSGTEDVFIEGGLEVDGYIYADGGFNGWLQFKIGGRGPWMHDDAVVSFGSNGSDGDVEMKWAHGSATPDAFKISIRNDESANIIITEHGNRDKEHSLAASSDPRVAIYSSTDPTGGDATQYLSLSHDTTKGIITSGKNLIHFPTDTIYLPQTYSDTVSPVNKDLYIDYTGRLGYNPSSIKTKKNIKDITGTERIYDLRPVSFEDKKSNIKCQGLIAEEVEKIMPELVSYDKQKKPETVNYSRLITPMLKEIQKLKKEIENLKKCQSI